MLEVRKHRAEADRNGTLAFCMLLAAVATYATFMWHAARLALAFREFSKL